MALFNAIVEKLSGSSAACPTTELPPNHPLCILFSTVMTFYDLQ